MEDNISWLHYLMVTLLWTHYLMVFVPVTLCKLACSIFHQYASYVLTSHCDDIREVLELEE